MTSAGPNIQKVKGLIEENCRLSCTELEAITGIPKSTVHEILRSHLDLRSVYSVWFPHKLSDNNQAARVRPATKQFLDRRRVPLVRQSLYIPDLNLLDRFLFRHIKMDLRGEDFSGPEDLSKAIQRSIRHISENTLVEELKNSNHNSTM